MLTGFKVFEDFENEKFVHLEDLKHMTNFMCGNLNSDYSLNYKYW